MTSSIEMALSDPPVLTFEYPAVAGSGRNQGMQSVAQELPARDLTQWVSVEQVQEMLAKARSEAQQECDAGIADVVESKLADLRDNVRRAVAAFESQATAYFSKVENEVVRLAMDIAAKILHREAQVDPMLVAALAKVAVQQLQRGTAVVMRVPVQEEQAWREHFSGNPPPNVKVEIVADAALAQGKCLLETELGTADVGIESQLREIERGFFDLLAQRPEADR